MYIRRLNVRVMAIAKDKVLLAKEPSVPSATQRRQASTFPRVGLIYSFGPPAESAEDPLLLAPGSVGASSPIAD